MLPDDIVVRYTFTQEHVNLTSIYTYRSAWDISKQKRVAGKKLRGRNINIVKDDLRDFTWKDILNVKEFRKSVRTTRYQTITIGYARKSNIKATIKSAIEKSLGLQVQKLTSKYLCEHVFVSFNSNADEPIVDRDMGKQDSYDVGNIKGNCQDMLDFTMSAKRIRLVTIDYAGLTTCPDDIRNFFSNHKQLKEMVIAEGHKVACFSRHDILKNDAIIEQFRCRRACVKRSVDV